MKTQVIRAQVLQTAAQPREAGMLFTVNYLRFLILQTVLAAGLAALWIGGQLDGPLHGESRYFCAVIWTTSLVGLVLVALRRYGDARWVQDNLLPLAVIGMQVGIIAGLSIAAQQVGSGGDMAKAVGAFFAAITVALYVSVSALAGHLWLKLNLKLLAPPDEQ